jgi:hypothetical protein
MFFWVSMKQNLLGEVDRVDGTTISTRFVYVNGLPFGPQGSVVQYEPADGSDTITVEIPLVGRSALAGYARGWSLPVGIGVALVGVIFGLAVESGLVIFASLAAGVALAVGMRRIGARIGRLSEDEKERRRIYGAWIGPSVDPLLCGSYLDPWIDQLRGLVAARARGAAQFGYRSAPETHKAWFEAALASDDPALLGAAFTLARAEMGRTADRAELAALQRSHEQLWAVLAPRRDQAKAVAGTAQLWTVAPIPGKPFPRPRSRLDSPWVWGPALAAMALTGVGLGVYHLTHPQLYVVNVSPHTRMVVLVDGRPFGAPIDISARGAGSEQARITTGEHVLEARDARTGEVIDETRVRIGWRDRGLIYAPARREGACMILQEAVYSSSSAGERGSVTLLDPDASAWPLRATLDYLLERPPEKIWMDSQSTSQTRWAAFLAPCPRQQAPAGD